MVLTPAHGAVMTPPVHFMPLQDDCETTKQQSKWVTLAHWVVGLIMAYVVFAVTVYFSPLVPPITTNVINPMWNVNPKVKGSGHSEMSVYTYFFFGMILPVFVAFLLVRFVTKGVPAPVPHVSHWLQRKPRFLYSLVSYGELLFLAVTVVGNIIIFYYFYIARVDAKSTYDKRMNVAAKTLGFSCVYNMVFLALPASRHCFWMEWLAIPYAHGIKYHRWLGIATVLAAILHMAFYVRDYYVKNDLEALLPCFNCDVGKEGKDHWINTFGWISFFCMFIMGVTSIAYVRRRYYNVFYVTHFLFVPATAFAIMHYGPIAIWLFAGVVLYIVNRMMSS
ncbi:hypothetical protein ACHHYP_06088, partial [Achlya hypogyna]